MGRSASESRDMVRVTLMTGMNNHPVPFSVNNEHGQRIRAVLVPGQPQMVPRKLAEHIQSWEASGKRLQEGNTFPVEEPDQTLEERMLNGGKQEILKTVQHKEFGVLVGE